MKTSYIDGIKSIEDFRRIPENELDDLAAEIREFLVRSVSKTGGISPPISAWWSLP